MPWGANCPKPDSLPDHGLLGYWYRPPWLSRKETVHVEAGSLGSEAVAHAAPDGYTLLIGTQGSHGTNNALYKAVRDNPVKDFVAVHGLLSNTPVLICAPQRKLTGVAALVEQARQQPGKLSFGSGGVGTAGHLLLELMQSTTGARFTHVP